MAADLKRADTRWPGVRPQLDAPEQAAEPQKPEETSNKSRLLVKKGAVVQPKTSVSRLSVHTHHERPFVRLDQPIGDVPPPRVESRTAMSAHQGRQPRAKLALHHNPHAVPTAHALNHSIVLTPKSVWDFYEAIEYSDNQGDTSQGHATLSRRRRSHPEKDERLFVIKEQRWPSEHPLQHFKKPQCQYLVELYGAFRSDATLWTVYEEMDMSLEQIFELDCDPWTINAGQKDAQISAISYQPEDDCKSFAKVLVRLYLPGDPREDLLQQQVDELPFGFYCCVRESKLGDALKRAHPEPEPAQDDAAAPRCVTFSKQQTFRLKVHIPRILSEPRTCAMQAADNEATRTAAVIDFLGRVHEDLAKAHVTERDDILRNASEELNGGHEYVTICAEALLLSHESSHAEPEWARSLHALSRDLVIHEGHPGDDTDGSEDNGRVVKKKDERLQAIARVTMVWGGPIVRHYAFDQFGRDTASPLARVAKRFPIWLEAVQRINAAMLYRHAAAMQTNKGIRKIGHHPGRSTVRGKHQPIQSEDLKLVMKWTDTCTVEIDGISLPDRDRDAPPDLKSQIDKWTTDPGDMPVPAGHLELDQYCLLVPRTKRKTSRALSTPRKKKKTQEGPTPGRQTSTPPTTPGSTTLALSTIEASPPNEEDTISAESNAQSSLYTMPDQQPVATGEETRPRGASWTAYISSSNCIRK
ncbi:hypothetical protein LTR85_012264 [Meristemomyces frigidus]|nr:hypothetical protein LTR85_012264 [Meristemomyces frigidus]